MREGHALVRWKGRLKRFRGGELGGQAHTFSVGHRQRDLHASGGLGLAEGRSARASAGKPWPLGTHRDARFPRRARLGGGASAMSIDMICNNGKALAKNSRRELCPYSVTLRQTPSF